MPDPFPAAVQPAMASSVVARRLRFSYLTAQKVWGVVFILPVLLLFIGFRLYPMLRAIEISFQRYDPFHRRGGSASTTTASCFPTSACSTPSALRHIQRDCHVAVREALSLPVERPMTLVRARRR